MSNEQIRNPKERGPIRRLFKSFVDVKTWLSYEELKSNLKNTSGLFKKLVSIRKSKDTEIRRESYEEAISRMALTEEQLKKRKQTFLYSALVYIGFALGFISYFIYLLINLRFLAAALTLMIAALMLVTAYREHLWYMQMTKKKLGCNFSDWLAFILRRNSK